jgi:hypothetical protein
MAQVTIPAATRQALPPDIDITTQTKMSVTVNVPAENVDVQLFLSADGTDFTARVMMWPMSDPASPSVSTYVGRIPSGFTKARLFLGNCTQSPLKLNVTVAAT